MSTPLTQAVLKAGANEHTLKRARLDDLVVTTDLQVFRAPFGSRWHKLGTGNADPEVINLSGALEAANVSLSRALIDALLADLPTLDTLKLGAWEFPVAGTTGAFIATPTAAGWRVQLSLIRAGAALNVP